MASSARDIIEELRGEIRRIERRAPACAQRVASGKPEVDDVLPGGGFPRGAISVLAGAPGSGKTQLALATIARALQGQGVAAFVDGRGELYPPAAAALGVDLDRLLIVQPGAHMGGDAMGRVWWAAETVLASGAFAVVALDLPVEGVLARAEAALRRLRAAAEKGGAAALWLAGEQGVRVPAAVRLELSRGAVGPRVHSVFARRGEGGAEGWQPEASRRAAPRCWTPAGGGHAA